MRFTEARLPGVWRIGLEKREDSRGFFARVFCEQEFGAHGLVTRYPQCNLSYNAQRGTLRGMHFQRPPKPEVKVVRCLIGAVYDVLLDLRPDSSMYLKHEVFELTGENGDALYVPEGIAHGFQTLTDDCEVLYEMDTPYHPESANGFRYDDPTFRIAWAREVTVIADKDLTWPPFLPR